MREFTLLSQEARQNVDLRLYNDLIQKTVKAKIPDATVIVKEKSYIVDSSPTKGQAIRIGKVLSKASHLGEHCIYVPKLFSGKEIDTNTQKIMVRGGRYRAEKKIY